METRFGRNRIVPRTHPRIRCEYFIDPILFYECSTSESERGIVRVSPRSRRTTRWRVAVGGKATSAQFKPLTRDESLFRPACVHQRGTVAHVFPLSLDSTNCGNVAESPRSARPLERHALGAGSSSFVIGASLSSFFSHACRVARRLREGVNARIAD